MEHQSAVWAAYIIAAIITLAFKLWVYVRDSEKYGKTKEQSFREWFFERTAENGASWIGTIGVVWVCGYLYINQLLSFSGIMGKVFESVPVSIPMAALTGYVAEMLAPAILKWATNKVTKALS